VAKTKRRDKLGNKASCLNCEFLSKTDGEVHKLCDTLQGAINQAGTPSVAWAGFCPEWEEERRELPNGFSEGGLL